MLFFFFVDLSFVFFGVRSVGAGQSSRGGLFGFIRVISEVCSVWIVNFLFFFFYSFCFVSQIGGI